MTGQAEMGRRRRFRRLTASLGTAYHVATAGGTACLLPGGSLITALPVTDKVCLFCELVRRGDELSF
jgi:hypothetical protein